MSHVYRIEVDSWPTTDGERWARFYGQGAAAPNHEIPAWLTALIPPAMSLLYAYRDPSPAGRVARRIRWDDDRDELVGVLMPVPQRKNFLSASGVAELARDMRAFGAEVRVIQSAAIEWPTPEARAETEGGGRG